MIHIARGFELTEHDKSMRYTPVRNILLIFVSSWGK